MEQAATPVEVEKVGVCQGPLDATETVLERVAGLWKRAGLGPGRWLLDRPDSNSGRLAVLVRSCGERHGLHWSAELVPDPDPELKASSEVVVSGDNAVLDGAARWCDLAGAVVAREEGCWLLDLDLDGSGYKAAQALRNRSKSLHTRQDLNLRPSDWGLSHNLGNRYFP